MKKVGILLAMASACSGNGSGTSVTPDMDSRRLGVVSGPFEAFTPATRGAQYVSTPESPGLALMMTNGTGAIGCSLIDPLASPGQEVSRVLITVLPSEAGISAPVCGPGAVAIHGNGDAVFEHWDQTGTKTAKVNALGGALSFASSPAGVGLARCDVSVTLTFPGGMTFSDTFSYNYDSYNAIQQTCIQSTACSCKPWQTCNAQNQCVNVSCVADHQPCPTDNSIACCSSSYGFGCSSGSCCIAKDGLCGSSDQCCSGRCVTAFGVSSCY
jgi:hypothetical protein